MFKTFPARKFSSPGNQWVRSILLLISDWKKYSDGNLYESIDNLQVKGAAANSYPATGPYACADIDGAKVDLRDKSSHEETVS